MDAKLIPLRMCTCCFPAHCCWYADALYPCPRNTWSGPTCNTRCHPHPGGHTWGHTTRGYTAWCDANTWCSATTCSTSCSASRRTACGAACSAACSGKLAAPAEPAARTFQAASCQCDIVRLAKPHVVLMCVTKLFTPAYVETWHTQHAACIVRAWLYDVSCKHQDFPPDPVTVKHLSHCCILPGATASDLGGYS